MNHILHYFQYLVLLHIVDETISVCSNTCKILCLVQSSVLIGKYARLVLENHLLLCAQGNHERIMAEYFQVCPVMYLHTFGGDTFKGDIFLGHIIFLRKNLRLAKNSAP